MIVQKLIHFVVSALPVEGLDIPEVVPKGVIDIKDIKHLPSAELPEIIKELEQAMNEAVDTVEFECSIELRDRIKELKKRK